jgi:DNA transposition AAA+ family ATPase
MAAHHFARWQDVTHELKLKTQKLIDYTWPPIKMDDFDTIIYVPQVSNSPNAVHSAIKDIAYDFTILVEKSIFKDKDVPWEERLKERVKLLIIDEADRLQPKSLEQVRDIYDRQKLAVVLIDMPGIEKRLVRSPQLYSRIGFAHVYKPLSEEEVAFIIQNQLRSLQINMDVKDFSDQEAIAALTRITQGNFRLINRLLKQIIRIMEVNQLSSITKEVVEAARECLVIGNIY